ncbi:MAG: signal recognition particle-docking protein FtsY [Maledivibacter sp.]|jgi:fused signal recognition particle receptor|nr:signal recognition particle-docking protein FtsY [Maledivibacter sp.]
MLKKIFGKFKKNNPEDIVKEDVIKDEEVKEDIIEDELKEETPKDEVKQGEEFQQSIDEGEPTQEEVIKEKVIQEETILDEINDIKEDETNGEITAEVSVEDENADLEPEQESGSFFSKLKSGLTKTRKGITEKIDSLMKSYTKVDEEFLEELEEILIVSDVGITTTMKIIEKLRDEIKIKKISDTEEVKTVLKDILEDLLTTTKDNALDISPSPAIVIVIGVNGVGKTTSIGKIAYNIKASGKKVLMAAGDTFRAAAIDQLKIWGDRVGVNVIHQQEGSDPAAIIYDAIQAAKARKIDVLICDTAGRLHNKKNLMNELGKVFKIIDREYPEARKEVLLVLDATTGQNAIQQAKTFKEVADITGITLTKLDGTAKGGVVLGITSELDIPVKFIGVGEGVRDLQPFNPKDFVKALLSDN